MEEEFLEWTRQLLDSVYRENSSRRIFSEWTMKPCRDTIYYVRPFFGKNLKRKYRKNCKI
jgi:hypothetical protein